MTQINIDTELSTPYEDSRQWRSYHLTASGRDLLELVHDATISEVDQDGGDIMSYGLEDAPQDVREEAGLVIATHVYIKKNRD